MNAELLFDPLFRVPFATGLLLSLLLPLLGAYLRLRQEWLAALGFAHLGGAGGVLGSVLGAPPLLAALAVAGLAVVARGLVRRAGNDLYAAMILAGWSAMLLGAGFGHHARTLAQTLVDGQLYFTGTAHLAAAGAFAVAVVLVMPRLSPLLLRLQLFPGHDRANGAPVRLAGLGFNMLVVSGVALAAMAMGVMAAFALIFVPAWIAFVLAPGWSAALFLASLIGSGAFLTAFVAALLLDLPFGPVLVAVLVLAALMRLLSASGKH